jgi:hypothetical protein
MAEPDFDEVRALLAEIQTHFDAGTLTYETWSPLFEQAHAAGGDQKMMLEAFLLYSSEEWMQRYNKEHKK